MRDIATGLGYALTIAVAAILFFVGYTQLLGLRSDALAMVAAGMCGAISATMAWPSPPGDEVLNRPRADLVIGSRTALLFYVLFTIATVVERFPEYFGEVDGVHQTMTTLLLSLPGLVVVSLGVMIYASMGAAFFLSVLIARFWVRQARRAHAAHPPAA
ncbi:hypothetical protein [Azospirillum sp.]|uniref:hypothetical protein n=1 Tax=Azospirillum sp. TaxID=34012 RepID=UPI003D707514